MFGLLNQGKEIILLLVPFMFLRFGLVLEYMPFMTPLKNTSHPNYLAPAITLVCFSFGILVF